MAGISHASAGSPVQDPNTCTFWDSILDIFYEADCGSQYTGLLISTGDSKPTITKYTGTEKETFIPLINGNEVCLYHKEGTNATNLNELQIALQEAQSSVPLWKVGTTYQVNDLVSYDNLIYKVIQSHTSQAGWTPNIVPALFSFYAFQELGEVPTWVQPTGSQDAYALGDRVFFEGYVYESKINANVWSPTTYPTGWTQLGAVYVSESNAPDEITIQTEVSNLVVPRESTGNFNIYCTTINNRLQIGNNTIIIEEQETKSVVYSIGGDIEIEHTIYWDVLHDGNYTNAVNDIIIFYEENKFGANWSSDNTTWEPFKYKIVSDILPTYGGGNNFDFKIGTTHRLNFDDICYEGANCTHEIYFNESSNKYILELFFYNKDGFIDPSYTTIATSGNLYNNTQYENNGNIHLDINDTGYRYAYSDDTSGNYIDISGADSTTYNNFSFSAWARVEDSEPYSSIFGADSGYITDASGGMATHIYSSEQIYFQLSNGSDQGYVFTTNNQVTLGQWAHIVGTYNGNTGDIKIYVDGAEATISSYLSNMTGPIYLPGGTKKTHLLEYNAGWFNGSVDEVMFFDSVLNSTQVSEIYNLNRTEYNGSTANLKHYWDFDDGPNDYTDKIGSADGTKAGTVRTIPYEPTIDTQFSSGQFNKPYDSLIAYYSFDADTSGTAYDLTANDNDGTITGAINTSGVYSSAKYFDGTDDVIVISDITLDASDGGSASLWFKTNSFGYSAPTGSMMLGKTASSTVYLYADTTTTIKVQGNSAGVANFVVPTMSPDTWYHVAFVKNNSQTRLWLNGVESSTGAVAQTQDMTISRIGAYSSIGYFNGSIDEVMLFSRALNSTQISDIYNNQSKRFVDEGTASYNPISLNETSNFVNVSLDSSQELYGTDIDTRVAYWDVDEGYEIEDRFLDNLVAYYTADSNANDYLGVYNGTMNGDANATEIGLFNNTFSFDGSDSITLGDIDLDGAFAISARVYFDDLTTDSYPIITKTGASYPQYVLDFLKDGSNRYYFRLFGYEGATAKGITGYTTSYIEAGKWYHVVASFDGVSDWRIYVDGVIVTQETESASLTTNDNDAILGHRAGTSFYDKGDIEDVMIFNRTLDLNEIRYLYNNGFANWSYSDYGNLNSAIEIPLSTTIKPELRLLDSTTEGWYTPYVTGNLTVTTNYFEPEIGFIPITSNGTQAEAVQTIYVNLSLNYTTQANVYLDWANGTNYDTQVLTSPNLNYTWTSVPFGDYLLNATAFADDGTTASTGTNAITLSADTTDPFINFTEDTPANDTQHGGDNLLELYTNQTDINPKNVTYYLFHNNGTLVDQHTLTWTTSPETLNWNFTIPISGMYYWYNATACDDYDNCNSTETRRVYVDFELAVLDLLLPLWENLYESTYVPLSYFAYDPSGVASVWYNVLYSSNGTNSTYISNTTLSGNTTITIKDVGSYYLNLWANDTVGNEGHDLTFFDVTNVSAGPEGPQGPTGPAGANGTSVDLLSQICKYKKLGYYNEQLPFLKEVNCI